jgi:SAM-dependent methyltransferase
LALWCAEQGASKPRDLELIASVLPFPRDEEIHVLDLCCGPGDVGRAIRREYTKAQIDGVDRDPFLTTICIGVNRREHIPGKAVVRDLEVDGWDAGLPGNYDVVATVNALHWFDINRAGALLVDVHRLLRSGGIFLFAEPASAEAPLASRFAAWKSKLPARYSQKNWERFWSRANAILGYDHVELLGPRHANRIGECLSVMGWIELARTAGFGLTDVLLRDADQVIVAAMKS